MKYGTQVTGPELEAPGDFIVTLSSVGNPDHGQDPNRPMYGVVNTKTPVRTLKQASEVCSTFIDDNLLGGGNWSGGQVRSKGKLVARVSYNGKVWLPA